MTNINGKGKGKGKLVEGDTSESPLFGRAGPPCPPPPGIPHVPLFQSMQPERANDAEADPSKPPAEPMVLSPEDESSQSPPGVPDAPLLQPTPQPSMPELPIGAEAGIPKEPFSYMTLLHTPDPEGYLWSYYGGPPKPPHPVDQILKHYGENLKQVLPGLVERLAMEKAAKSLQEKQEELNAKTKQASFLEVKMKIYKEQAEKLASDVKRLEKKAMSLNIKINAAKEARGDVEEEDETYYVDMIRLGDMQLDCKVCEKRVARAMMLPCRHVCVCFQCDRVTMTCPVCGQQKERSVEVFLPPSN